MTAEEREKIVREVEKYVKFEKVILQKASATIASNTGRHSFALIFRKKEETKKTE